MQKVKEHAIGAVLLFAVLAVLNLITGEEINVIRNGILTIFVICVQFVIDVIRTKKSGGGSEDTE